MITTAHAHKSGVIFHFFPRAFKQKKIKALRPKMTKIASRGGGSCLKKSEAMFCRSVLLLSFFENRLCLSQLIKKLNSTERGALFQHFCVPKVITTARAHKSGIIFHFFQELSNKALRPKMTKIASTGSCLKSIVGSCVRPGEIFFPRP